MCAINRNDARCVHVWSRIDSVWNVKKNVCKKKKRERERDGVMQCAGKNRDSLVARVRFRVEIREGRNNLVGERCPSQKNNNQVSEFPSINIHYFSIPSIFRDERVERYRDISIATFKANERRAQANITSLSIARVNFNSRNFFSPEEK